MQVLLHLRAPVGLASLLLLIVTGCSAAHPEDGPLQLPGGDAVVTTEAAVGQTVAFGYNVMTNPSSSPISNIEASLISEGAEHGNDVLFEPAVVVDIGAERIDYLGAGKWPSEQWSKHATPLEGYTLLPDAGGRVELFFIARVNAKGEWIWPKTRVAYDYKGKRYIDEVTNGFSICAPAPCTPPVESPAS